jgi:hypothetical protein
MAKTKFHDTVNMAGTKFQGILTTIISSKFQSQCLNLRLNYYQIFILFQMQAPTENITA